jgi:hypothetical protein
MKFYYYVWTQQSSHHLYPRVSRIFESIYTFQGKIWQHDTRRASQTPYAATIRDNDQRVGLGPTFPYCMSSTRYLTGLFVGDPYTISVYITTGEVR